MIELLKFMSDVSFELVFQCVQLCIPLFLFALPRCLLILLSVEI